MIASEWKYEKINTTTAVAAAAAAGGQSVGHDASTPNLVRQYGPRVGGGSVFCFSDSSPSLGFYYYY